MRDLLSRDGAAAGALEKADIIVGNPPWVNWEYLPAHCRGRSGDAWAGYGLLSAKGLDLSFSKEDVSVLITCAAVDRLLKEGGILGFILRQGLFKSAQNGAGFRRFRAGAEIGRASCRERVCLYV